MKNTPICDRGSRERAPGAGVVDSDVLTHLSGTTQADGKRERAPLWGVTVSDIPAPSLAKTFLDRKRERAPVKGGRHQIFPPSSPMGPVGV